MPARLSLRQCWPDGLDDYVNAVAAIEGHAEQQRADKATNIGVPSSRNLQRAGFRPAYNYVMLRPPLSA